MNAMAALKTLWILVILACQHVYADFQVNNQDLTIIVGGRGSFNLTLTEKLKTRVHVAFDVEHNDLLRTEPASFNVSENDNNTAWNITVLALSPGSVTISLNVTPEDATRFSDAFVRVKIERSEILFHMSTVVGWIYFLAWSVSFYPQIYSNYKRQSVVGLNFDFLSLNIVGFIMYALFNCGLYWIPEVEDEYFRRYPKGLNPVQVNDIFFALHAVLATMLTIAQCFIYEIGSQRVSFTARSIHGIFISFILVSALLSITQVITWLDFLYYCSYVKLAITLIKYVPQAYYNYQRKSTVGWSIGNIFLDFTGGMLSMLQMILNAYNYDDWESLFGDPTKFGLGFFSVAFDIFFLVQHYVLYRDRLEYTELSGTCQAEPESQDTSIAKNSNAMNARLPKLLENISQCFMFTRKLNCWTSAITKKHRKIYERTYPTVLVFPNGSAINIRYSEPRQIIRLPIDLSLLSEAERKKLLEKRVPKSKVVIEEDIEDDFDENRYLKYAKS